MKKAKKLEARIRTFAEELARETDEAKSSERLLDYFRFAANFRRYSINNTILIFLQCPHATQVAGYRTWQKLGRQVKQGEKGIMILAPVTIKLTEHDSESDTENNTEKTFTTFKAVYVFDVSQTEGADLPEPGVITGEHCREELTKAAIKFAERSGISVAINASLGSAYGVSRGGAIELDETLKGADFFSVLIHELAHELLQHHTQRKADRKVTEAEAETAAHVVCRHFNIASTAPTYLALHRIEGEKILGLIEDISETVDRIISGIEAEFTEY